TGRQVSEASVVMSDPSASKHVGIHLDLRRVSAGISLGNQNGVHYHSSAASERSGSVEPRMVSWILGSRLTSHNGISKSPEKVGSARCFRKKSWMSSERFQISVKSSSKLAQPRRPNQRRTLRTGG